MNNLAQRTITGAVFIAVLISCILLSQYTFAGLFLIIANLSLLEFYSIITPKFNLQINKVFAVFSGSVLFASIYLEEVENIDFPYLSLYLVLLCILMILELYRKKENPVANWAFFVLGQIYIILPFSLLSVVAVSLDGSYNSLLLFSLFCTIWINDTGAYVVGMTLGKHKMFPRISPKKSWEGFIGGLFFALVLGYVFSIFEPQMTCIQWVGFATVVVAFSTFGDLCESLLKRQIGVKDSGTILPGHGGMLDRFDSAIFAAVGACFYLQII